MSQRHQTNRRKSYGRRQHELRQRSDRRAALPELTDATWEDPQAEQPADALAFLDMRGGRVRFALGD